MYIELIYGCVHTYINLYKSLLKGYLTRSNEQFLHKMIPSYRKKVGVKYYLHSWG